MQTILIADDSAMMRKIIRRAVSEVGAEIVEAEDGREALDIIEDRGNVDLLITDLNMPRMTGDELLAALEGQPHRPPHVVVISSTLSTLRRLELTRLGVDRLVGKPFQPERLLMDLQDLLPSPTVCASPVPPSVVGVLDTAVSQTLSRMAFRVGMPMPEPPEDLGEAAILAEVTLDGVVTGALGVAAPHAWCATLSGELTGAEEPHDFAAELLNMVAGGMVGHFEATYGSRVELGIPSVRDVGMSVEVSRAYRLDDDSIIGILWELNLPEPAGADA